VYGNFFIRDNTTTTASYGIRVIDKGHRIYNNYFEGLNGNSGGTSQNRAVISVFNGLSTDTTNAAAASGYFPADSIVVAFNTIVDCKGGGGIVLGNTSGGTIEPKGFVLANNLVKMNAGTALYMPSTNVATTFSSEGNIYQAPSGLGVTANGWNAQTISFTPRSNGFVHPPSLVVDAAVNSASYAGITNALDVVTRVRSGIYDVGCEEINGTGEIVNKPLSSCEVGAGAPSCSLPLHLLTFSGNAQGNVAYLQWTTANELNVHSFIIEFSTDGNTFTQVKKLPATNRLTVSYHTTHPFGNAPGA